MHDAIVLRGLTKTFGDTVAVRDSTGRGRRGLVRFDRPNGAGKTTRSG